MRVAAALAAIAIVTRIAPLRLGFWNDEAYSAVAYIDAGPRAIFLGEYVPNNHVLFSLLAWATVSLLGRSEAVYRLWSVVPALLAVAIATAWAWRRLGAWTAVTLLFLLATSPVHLDLAPQARGYGLGFLAAALTVTGALEASEAGPGRLAWALLGVGGAIGILTLPVFVLPFLGAALAAGASPGGFAPAAVVTAAVALLAAAFYAPLLSQIARASGQSFGDPLAWWGVAVAPFYDLIMPWQATFVPEIPGIAALLGFWALVALGLARLARIGRARWIPALVAPVAVTYAGLWLTQVRVVPRFNSALVIPASIVVALGLVEAARVAATRRWLAVTAAIAASAALVAGGVRFAARATETALIPYEAYGPASRAALAAGIPEVVTNARYFVGFRYYGGGRIRFADAAELQRLFCDPERDLVFVHSPLFEDPVDVSCLEARGATATTLTQRHEHSWMRVWVARRTAAPG